jgi:predicted nucleic acid-binding protein
MARKGFYHPIWSQRIFEEVFNTSRKKLGQNRINGLNKRVFDMNTFFPNADYEGPIGLESELKLLLPDPDDAHVIATAIASESKFIVTQNLRDYPEHLLSAWGITAISFDAFMIKLFGEDSKKVIEGLSTLIELKSNPTISLREHLLQLESYSPNFNRIVREYLPKNT